VVKGLIPACVEICKAGALTWETVDEAMRRKNRQVSRAMSSGAAEQSAVPPGMALLQTIKKVELELSER
jgi:carbon-monoxide dehydrogenase iron sulfur subunit